MLFAVTLSTRSRSGDGRAQGVAAPPEERGVRALDDETVRREQDRVIRPALLGLGAQPQHRREIGTLDRRRSSRVRALVAGEHDESGCVRARCAAGTGTGAPLVGEQLDSGKPVSRSEGSPRPRHPRTSFRRAPASNPAGGEPRRGSGTGATRERAHCPRSPARNRPLRASARPGRSSRAAQVGRAASDRATAVACSRVVRISSTHRVRLCAAASFDHQLERWFDPRCGVFGALRGSSAHSGSTAASRRAADSAIWARATEWSRPRRRRVPGVRTRRSAAQDTSRRHLRVPGRTARSRGRRSGRKATSARVPARLGRLVRLRAACRDHGIAARTGRAVAVPGCRLARGDRGPSSSTTPAHRNAAALANSSEDWSGEARAMARRGRGGAGRGAGSPRWWRRPPSDPVEHPGTARPRCSGATATRNTWA